MKKSTPFLALGLGIFLWACSTTTQDDHPLLPPIPMMSTAIAEVDFLNKVQGKVAYANETIQNTATKLGTFSADGRSFLSSGLLGSADTIVLDEVIDTDTVTYTFVDPDNGNLSYTFTMFSLDGITGTVSSSDPHAGMITTDAWLVSP